MKLKTLLAALALILMLVPTYSRQAQAQGRHPHYLRALSDLRLARAYLDRLTPSERLDDAQTQAVHELEKAIGEIKAASIDDGKDIRFHEPIDARILPRDRWTRAHEALDAAERDVEQEEDDNATRGLQTRIKAHISNAITVVRNIQAHLR
jgi:hypothetical protein